MLRKLLFIQIFSLFFIVHAFSLEIPVYTVQIITSFNGDRHGEFENDLVAILNDGSGWKVHPEDRNKFSAWDRNDAILVRKRTSFYWFKREHKFELYNHSNNETVRAMIVRYPTYPLSIEATDIYKAYTDFRMGSWMDSKGTVHYYSYTVDVFYKLVFLSDGTSWVITDSSEFSNFCMNDIVYLGFNKDDKYVSPFLISGIQRQARWVWLYKRK